MSTSTILLIILIILLIGALPSWPLSRFTPNNFKKAGTDSWCSANHFLIVTIDGDKAQVKPIGGMVGDELSEISRLSPRHENVTGVIEVAL